MPIAYYSGPEGSGKSVMMGRDCLYHHSCGGKVYAFPGFEVMNNRGRVISLLLMPEEWMNLLVQEEANYAVAIDEIANFLNHHKWFDQIVDLITYGAAAQRRKRSMVILATGPIFEWLPKDLSYMFHEVIRLEDRHWKIKSIPRGEQAIFTREDRRGVLSGDIGRMTHPEIFKARKYWKNINTYSLVDPRYQLNKVRFQRKEIMVGTDGKVIEPDAGAVPVVNTEAIERLANQYNGGDNAREVIARIVDTLKKKGIQIIPKQAIKDMVASQGLTISPFKMGSILREHNLYYKSRPGPQGDAYAFG